MVHAYVCHVTGCIEGHFALRSHNESHIILLSLSVSSETLKVLYQHIYRQPMFTTHILCSILVKISSSLGQLALNTENYQGDMPR